MGCRRLLANLWEINPHEVSPGKYVISGIVSECVGRERNIELTRGFP